MKEHGTIREVHGARITVEIEKHMEPSCNQCSLHGKCNAHTKERLLTVWVNDRLAVGQEVMVEMKEGMLITIAVLLFLVPVVLLIASIAVVSQWFSPIVSLLITLGVIGVYYFGLRCFTPHVMQRSKLTPIKNVGEEGDDVCHHT